MTQHLLLVSLGPVQDFIAAARRCQDLWYGSWLLSHLSRATATAIRSAVGEEALIFPGALGNDKAAIANKLLTVVPAGHDPAAVAERGRQAMNAALDQLATRLLDTLSPATLDRVDRPMIMAQLADLMEYLWAAVPLADGPEDYAKARHRVERLLAARKATRTWAQPAWTQPKGRPKSSLDGARESVLDERLFGEDAVDGADRRRRDLSVKKAERLGGVGLLKRLGQATELEGDNTTRPAFHSTSHMAAAPVLTRIVRRQADGALSNALDDLWELGVDKGRFTIRAGAEDLAYVGHPFAEDPDDADPTSLRGRGVPRTFDQHGHGQDTRGFDGSLLFPSRAEDVCEESGVSDRKSVDEYRKVVTRLLRDLDLSPEGPTPYYALLLADGDHMGKAIDALGDMELHRGLSRNLDAFALGAAETVARHAGSLVYAGGDDVLALVPLHTALACARKLYEDFAAAMGKPLDDRAHRLEMPNRPTLSVGLAVAHHLTPMGEALDLARRAERLAKVRRDSLAVLVDPRSGAELAATLPWSGNQKEDDRKRGGTSEAGQPDQGGQHGEAGQGAESTRFAKLDLAGRLNAWAWLLAKEALPDGAAFRVEEAVRPFLVRDAGSKSPEPGPAQPDASSDAKPSADPLAAFDTEVESLLKLVIRRRDARRGTEDMAGEVQKLLHAALARPATADGQLPSRKPSKAHAALALSAELQIARLFLRAYRDAWGDDLLAGPSPLPTLDLQGGAR